MNATATTAERISSAVAALGPGPLTEAALQTRIAPLFSRHRAQFAGRIYLANHSLGRPLDTTADDLAEGLAAWYAGMGGAWSAWDAELAAHRGRIARLLGASRPDCVVPKTSAGQGLRAVLSTFEGVPRVVATRGEFDSLDLILREYARRRRIALALVEARDDGRFDTGDIVAAIRRGCDLVVVSEVFFATGQRVEDPPEVVAAAHAEGARVLLDVYHSLGVFPVAVEALGVDFAVGGGYKYLRGGPGACFLHVAPKVVEAGITPLDIGWFAKERPFDYTRPDPPRLAAGGDGWLESTPPVLTYFQARSGTLLAINLGVGRLRAHSLTLQARLVALLAERGIAAQGGTEDRGAFVVVRHDDAPRLAEALAARGVITDARGPWLRLCPDILTTEIELHAAAETLAAVS